MRSLSLAAALSGRGAAMAVVAHPGARPVLEAFADPSIERLAVAGGSLNELVGQANAAADAWGADAIVVDHYGLTPIHETRLRGQGRQIIVIDDIKRTGHNAGLLIDPSFGRGPRDYPDIQRSGGLVLAGPDYALLRADYAAARPAALARRQTPAPVRRLLVSLGLTDVRGITGRVIQLLRPELGGLMIDVAVGSGVPSLPWLRHLAASDPNIAVHVDTTDMARLMSEADIAVGAGGSSVWERACLGLPALNLVLAENQQPLALALEAHGACLTIDARQGGLGQDLAAAFVRLRDDQTLRIGLSETSAKLCDGLGAGRSADAILTLVSRL